MGKTTAILLVAGVAATLALAGEARAEVESGTSQRLSDISRPWCGVAPRLIEAPPLHGTMMRGAAVRAASVTPAATVVVDVPGAAPSAQASVPPTMMRHAPVLAATGAPGVPGVPGVPESPGVVYRLNAETTVWVQRQYVGYDGGYYSTTWYGSPWHGAGWYGSGWYGGGYGLPWRRSACAWGVVSGPAVRGWGHPSPSWYFSLRF